MNGVTCLTSFVLYLYPTVILMFVSNGYGIVHFECALSQKEFSQELQIKPDIISTIIWVIISLFIYIYQFKSNQWKKNYSNKFTMSLIIGILSLLNWVMMNYNIDIKYIHSLCSISTISFVFYKCCSMYETIMFEYSWFDYKYKDNSIPNNNLKWIIYLIINITLFVYCFIYLDDCNLVSVRCAFQIISMVIPYLILLIPSNQKYDLYFHRKQLIISIICGIAYKMCLIINSFFDKRLINPMAISLTMIPSAFVVLPYLMDMVKNRNLVNILKKNPKILKTHWWEYILSNDDAFDKFQSFLLQNKVYENMLFIFEVMQYKHAVLNRLKNKNMNRGYLLTFDDENLNKLRYISPIAESIYDLNVEEINMQRIKIDITILYEKYMSIDYDVTNKLFVSFIHSKNKEKLKESIYCMSDNNEDILNVFDSFMKECDNILQLLYREYVIEY